LRFPHRVGGLEGIVVPPPALGRLDVSEKPVRRKQAAEAIKARVNSSTQGRTADRTRVSVTSASRHIMSDELRSGYRRAPCMYAQQLCTVWIGFMAEREREREEGDGSDRFMPRCKCTQKPAEEKQGDQSRC
jgi:hypothetical protein